MDPFSGEHRTGLHECKGLQAYKMNKRRLSIRDQDSSHGDLTRVAVLTTCDETETKSLET